MKEYNFLRPRKAYGEAEFNRLFDAYRRSAQKDEREFSLSEDEFRTLTKGDCYYCGSEPKQAFCRSNSTPYFHNGLDRINNHRGYVVGNVVPCCKHCNYAKRDLSQADFIAWLQQASDHLKLVVEDVVKPLLETEVPA
jgi:hypothetical protein